MVVGVPQGISLRYQYCLLIHKILSSETVSCADDIPIVTSHKGIKEVEIRMRKDLINTSVNGHTIKT